MEPVSLVLRIICHACSLAAGGEDVELVVKCVFSVLFHDPSHCAWSPDNRLHAEVKSRSYLGTIQYQGFSTDDDQRSDSERSPSISRERLDQFKFNTAKMAAAQVAALARDPFPLVRQWRSQ